MTNQARMPARFIVETRKSFDAIDDKYRYFARVFWLDGRERRQIPTGSLSGYSEMPTAEHAAAFKQALENSDFWTDLN
jgi:hypothetical protein